MHTSRKHTPLSYRHATYSEVILSGASQGTDERMLGPVQPRPVSDNAQPRDEREPGVQPAVMVR